MMVSKDATKGGGGMDIATKKDNTKLMTAAKKLARFKDPKGRISDQDISRAMSILRGVISPNFIAAESALRSKKAGGGKLTKKKKMMAKGGTAGGKKQMMMKGGKAKKMMMGGGKAKKMMAGGGKSKKYMARGGKAR